MMNEEKLEEKINISSTHKVEVVPVELLKHPNADKLSIVNVWGYSVCVNTEQWKDKTIGAYIVPDSIVDTTRPEFAFLEKDGPHIKVKKLRGILSQGLLVPAPTGSKIGDDVAEILGVKRYEPAIEDLGEGIELPPPGAYVTYKIDAFERYAKEVFVEGEEVIATEKINGISACYTFKLNRMYCGARRCWYAPTHKSQYWRALDNNPVISKICSENPNLTLYGEVYCISGNGMKYGKTDVDFMLFDILESGRWMEYDEIQEFIQKNYSELKQVPLVYRGPFNIEKLKELSQGKSLLADHRKEGIVIKPIKERTNFEIGRVQLKLVSSEYLEKGWKI